MFHLTYPIPNWPLAAYNLPPHTTIKFTDNIQALSEAKSINPNIVGILRHIVYNQQPGDDYHENVAIAQHFLSTFIDGTFKDGVTHGVPHREAADYIEGWNEYAMHPGQDAEELRRYRLWVQALLDVWYGQYWPEFGINLIVGNIAVGNDPAFMGQGPPMRLTAFTDRMNNTLASVRGARVLNTEEMLAADLAEEAAAMSTWAEAVARHTDVAAGKIPRLGYHAYWLVQNQVVQGGDESWRWYQGRWASIDTQLQAQGIHVHWALTEAGAVGARGTWPNISLDPIGGWRTDYVYGGNWSGYAASIRRFMATWHAWNDANGHRCLSPNLFNSGGHDHWPGFQLDEPQLSAIAVIAQDYPTRPPDAIEPPPPPPPSPTIVRVKAASNLRLSPYFDSVRGRWNKILVLQPGARLELFGYVPGQVYGGSSQWAKVGVNTGWLNGDSPVEAYIHSLLVDEV